jgi:hypothetical protein
MAHLVVRRLLRRVGLLRAARAAKSRISPVHHSFMPCTPHLLVAVQRSLRWWQEAGRGSEGDYLEFGIFRGFTFWYSQALAADMGIERMRFSVRLWVPGRAASTSRRVSRGTTSTQGRCFG